MTSNGKFRARVLCLAAFAYAVYFLVDVTQHGSTVQPNSGIPNQEAATVKPTFVPNPKPLSVTQKREMAKAARKLIAEGLDEKLLDTGFNTEVTDVEGKAPTLRIKYALASRVVAYQMGKQLDLDQFAGIGFKHVVLTDGYDETWTWDLPSK